MMGPAPQIKGRARPIPEGSGSSPTQIDQSGCPVAGPPPSRAIRPRRQVARAGGLARHPVVLLVEAEDLRVQHPVVLLPEPRLPGVGGVTRRRGDLEQPRTTTAWSWSCMPSTSIPCCGGSAASPRSRLCRPEDTFGRLFARLAIRLHRDPANGHDGTQILPLVKGRRGPAVRRPPGGGHGRRRLRQHRHPHRYLGTHGAAGHRPQPPRRRDPGRIRRRRLPALPLRHADALPGAGSGGLRGAHHRRGAAAREDPPSRAGGSTRTSASTRHCPAPPSPGGRSTPSAPPWSGSTPAARSTCASRASVIVDWRRSERTPASA